MAVQNFLNSFIFKCSIIVEKFLHEIKNGGNRPFFSSNIRLKLKCR